MHQLDLGRSESYLLAGMNENRCDKINEGNGKGIQGAINQYEKKITDIVSKIKSGKLNQKDIEDGEYSETNEIVRMVGEAHDYVVKHMIYKHEYEVSLPDQAVEGVKGHTVDHVDEKSTSRTVYDGLIYGEGVCEAYTRTFKAILDRLGIPCICVYGIYSPKSTINEPHIWNYVQIDGKWYGVDVTHDDPGYGRWTYTKESGRETREFFLVGTTQLSSHHFPSGMLSSANYEFEYPTLAVDSYRESYNYSTPDGFDVVVEKDTQEDDQTGETFDSGTYYVSYNGKNFTENAKEGKYILIRYFTYAPNSDRWDVTEWNYIDPWALSYGEPGLTEKIEPPEPKVINNKKVKCVRLELPQVKRVQFAITDIPPAYIPLRKEYENRKWDDYVMVDGLKQPTPEFKDWGTRMWNALNDGAAQYTQNVDNLKIKTEEIENKWGDFVAPPTPIKCTPYQGGSLTIGSTHHIKLQFDESLALATKDSVPGVQFYASRNEKTANEYSKLTNVKWDGDKTIEFDFWASDMWGDDNMFYNFQPTGLVGVDSGKMPYPATYGLVFQKTCRLVKPDGVHRVVYAQPQLMETSDIDVTKWVVKDSDNLDENGNVKQNENLKDFLDEMEPRNSQAFLDALKDRLTLVTTEPSPNRTEQMEDALENSKYKDDFEDAVTVNTYNISLTVCKKCLVYTGEAVRINLGFPSGTSYEDYAESGRLSFKAYHYIVDPLTDELTGEVEEIPVTVTRQGLILMVESFSPFTVTAVENEVKKAPTQKELVVAKTVGGKITQGDKELDGKDGVLKMNEGGSQTVTITPDKGYQIDFVTLDGVRQKITNKDGESFTVNYDNFATGALLDVGFVAKEIHEEEEKKGLSSDFEIPNIGISFEDDKTEFEYVVGDEAVIKPIVAVSGGDFNPTKDENFDPKTANEKNHPDYIKYEWYTNASSGNAKEFVKLENQTKKNLDIGEVSLENNGHSYYLVVTPMKWNESTNEYEPMKEKDTNRNFNQVSKTISLSVYPELQLELTSDNEKKPSGNSEDGYTITLDHGDTYNLMANMYRIYDGKHEPATRMVKWISEDEKIVHVTESGYLTILGYSDDPVKVTATVTDVNGTTKTVSIDVTAKKVAVKSVQISNEKMKDKVIELEAGETVTLHANITPENASDKLAKWEIVEGEDYFTLTQAGKVTVKNDEATINKLKTDKKITGKVKVTVGGVEDTCTIIIVPTKVERLSDDIENHDIYIAAANAEGLNGESKIEIDINVVPENATNKELKVESTDKSIVKASIDKEGDLILEAQNYNKDKNTCTVTVSSVDNPSAKLVYNVTVTEGIEKVTGVEVVAEEGGKTKLKVGEGVDLNAKITPTDATFSHIEWFIKEADGKYVTSNEYAEINNSGYIIAKKAKNEDVKINVVAKVTCQTPQCPKHESKVFTITIVPTPVDTVTIHGDKEITLRRNDKVTLTAEVGPDDATDKTITWTSSDKKIATVDKNGLVTAVKAGDAEITAKAGNKKATVKVKVTPIEVEGLVLDNLSLKVKDNDKNAKLNVSFYPENADEADLKYVEWISSDEKVAKVDAKGNITPIKAGKVTITARLKGNTKVYEECEVTVVPSKTNLVLYTVDQNTNFIAGIGIRLTKKDANGVVTTIGEEVISTGKVEFADLEDGEYTVYVTTVPETDVYGNPLNITNVIEYYTFVISDGQVLYTSSDDKENTILKNADSLVIVSTTNGEDANVVVGNDFKDLEKEYKEFYKLYTEQSKQPDTDEPDTPPIQNNPNAPDNPDYPVYSGNQDDDGNDDNNNGGGNNGDNNNGDNGNGDNNNDNEGNNDNNNDDNSNDNSNNNNNNNNNNDNENNGNNNNNNNSNNNSNNNQSSSNATNNNSENSQNNSGVPKTGDIAITTYWIIMNVSLLGILFIVCKKHNLKNKKTKHSK